MVIALAFLAVGCSLESESAYDIAVRNGFVGTETEWLASLKGEKGDTGATGADGADGENFNLGYTAEDIYNEAVAKGYSGTFMDFTKEIFGVETTEEEAPVANVLFTACNIISQYKTSKSTTVYESGGAGVFYSVDKTSGDAYVITNFHVVYQAESTTSNKICETINVFLFGDIYFADAITAEYIGGSANYDIAVLKIKNSEQIKNSNVLQADFGDSNAIHAGDKIWAVGNPESSGSSVTQGVVSVDSEYIDLEDVYGTTVSSRVIRIDAGVNPGNSGGGLFNAKGQLIGIVNAKLIKDDFDSIGYAIPVNLAKAVAKNIIDNCDNSTNEQVKRAVLGIEVEASNTKAVYDSETKLVDIVEDITIKSIYENSPMLLRLKVGDVINSITFEGKTYTVSRLHIVSDVLLNARLGDTVNLNITRNNINSNVSFIITSSYISLVS